MRVLVAGASGAIGRHLVPQLVAARHSVIGLTRVAGSLEGTGAREIVVDVLDRAALLAELDGVKADAVVHQLTALRKPPINHRDMRATNRLRTEGTSALIAAARAVGAKRLVAASFFGGYGFRDIGRLPVEESAPFGEVDGRNDAVLTALLSLEQQVRAFGGISLRYGLFYGEGDTSVSPVARHWNGLLPMVHHADAASAVVRALTKGSGGEVYNIADNNPVSYRAREVARARAFGHRRPLELPESVIRMIAPYGSQLVAGTNMRLSSGKARSELGWTPTHESITAWADSMRRSAAAGSAA